MRLPAIFPLPCPAVTLLTAVAALSLAGCRGVPTAAERQARSDSASVTALYRPQGLPPNLPLLTTNSTLEDFLRFAMFHHPQVEASYHEWLASVERITVERSLPDPRLTFEADIANVILTAMPGLMMDFPGPGKLAARAAVASAESQARYYAFERAVLQAAFDLKKAYYDLQRVQEELRINRETLSLLQDVERIARTQNEAGLVTMADVLRAQIEQERMRTEIAGLEDSLSIARAQWKGALGIAPGDPDPPVPTHFEPTELDVPPADLLKTALARNPRLKELEAEVQLADASIRLAARAKVPDFNAGIETDALASPVMVRPLVGMTLPIWRDKIAAEIASAQARNRAATARLSAEQIQVAVGLAEKSYLFREADRKLVLYEGVLLPKARLSLDATRTAYLSGRVDFLNLLNSFQTLLGFELTRIESQAQREVSLAELSLVIAGLPPSQAPLLKPAEHADASMSRNH